MNQLLEILIKKYRVDSITKFLCCFIQRMKLQEGQRKELLKFIGEKATGSEALEICTKYNVELQEFPMNYGIFADNHLNKRQQRKLRIEWLKLLLRNE